MAAAEKLSASIAAEPPAARSERSDQNRITATKRDPPRDVRAADLQADPTKRIPKAELIMRDSRFVGFGEDGGSTANIAASEASH